MLDPNGLLIADRFLAGPPGPAAGGVCEREALDKLTGLRCRVFEIDLAGREAGCAGPLERWSAGLLGVRHPSLENLLAARPSADGRSVYWVYEEISGKSLAALAAEGRPFHEAEAAGLAAALAGALRALRAAAPGLPSLEVRPETIFLAEGGRPVLAGTRYFAPSPAGEAWHPAGSMKPAAAEVYSLGLSLACLFSGRPPEELRAGVSYSDLKKRTGFSADFCGILWNALAGRYASAAALERDLARFLAGAPPSRLRAAGRALLAAGLLLASGWFLSGLEPGNPVKLKGGEVEWCVPGGLAFSPSGDRLAQAGDKELYLWSAGDWKRPRAAALRSPDGQHTRSVAFFPDGRLALGSVGSQGVSSLRVLSGSLTTLWEGPLPGTLDSLAVSPDGALLAAAVDDYEGQEVRGVRGRILLFDAATLKPVRELATPGGPAHSVVFSPDGRSVVYRTLHWQEAAKLFNLGRVVRRSVDGGDEEVLFSDGEPGFRLGLFAWRGDGTAVLPRPGSELAEVRAPGGRLVSQLNGDSAREAYTYVTSSEGVFSRDGTLFAGTTVRGGRVRLRVYDASTWRQLKEFKLAKWRAGGAAGVAFSADGRSVAVSQGDAFASRVRVFELGGKN